MATISRLRLLCALAALAAFASASPALASSAPDGGVEDAGAPAPAPLPPGLEVVDVASGFFEASLSAAAQWAQDPSRELGIEQVASPSAGGLEFRRTGEEFPHFEYTRSAVWARAGIANDGKGAQAVVLEVAYPLIDRIDLFLSRDGGRTWEHRQGGDEKPFDDREADVRNVTFSLRAEPGEQILAVLRFESTSSVQLPLKLWSATAFAAHEGRDQVWYGLLYGVLIAMVLYHLFLFFPTRNRSYLYYCAYMAFGLFVLASLIGHGYQYVWPDSPWFEGVAVPFAVAAWIALACIFTRHFLRTWEASRLADRLLVAQIAVSALSAAMSLFGDVRFFTRLNIGLCIFAAASTTIIGFVRWRQGFRAARFFFIAWIVFSAGVILYALKSLGVVPSNEITQNGMNVGTAVEAILISMALGDYINTLRDEQDRVRGVAARQETTRASKMGEIRDLAAFLSEVAGAMSDVMERLGRSSRDVAAALAEANTTIEQIEKSATSVSGNAARIANESKRLSVDFNRGREAMDSTASAIDRVQSESGRIAEMTKALFSHVEAVDDVVGLVRSVSAQSKVLAVNASIEAANAGELGKGFGVIAVEVSHLAQQSTEATAHVNELLGLIRTSLGKIVEAAGLGAQQSQGGAAAIGSARRVVRELGEGMNASATGANQIATSIAEQTSGISHILAAMERIGGTAQENLDATKGMARAAADVRRTAEKLHELVKSWDAAG
jgi:two-component system, sensor histidine kinase LadS